MTMEDTTPRSFEHVFNPTLVECEPAAFDRLDQEIDAAGRAGYDVEVIGYDDPAYQSPTEIRQMYVWLESMQQEFQEWRDVALRRSLGELVCDTLLRSPRQRRRARRSLEEGYRETHLYGKDQTNSMPWHQQAGRATALISITAAHELAAARQQDEGQGYPTMSGPLGRDMLDFAFPSNRQDDMFAGLSLKDALVQSRMEFDGKECEQATAWAQTRLDQLEEFLQAPSTTDFVRIARYSIDGLGMRSRKAVVNSEIVRYVSECEKPVEDMTMMSLGCGTALPMLEALHAIKHQTGGTTPRLLLVDQDPIALAAAASLAEQYGLSDTIELHCERLFNRFGRPLELDTILHGRVLDVVEDSGLREYLPDRVYCALTQSSWRQLSPGGLMVTGHINQNRAQRDFPHGLMGWWPHVKMRRIVDNLHLHEKAGIPHRATKVRVCADGIYSVFVTKKQ